jgi:hypothetical protein
VVGDVDGDLDVDLLLVGRGSGPRLFHSRLSDTGTPIFRDMTGLAWPEGHGGGTVKYDSELVDLDGDDDLDVYGVNWLASLLDPTLRNTGHGSFVDLTGVPGSQADQDACDVVDYDSDGDLDVYVAKFSGVDKLFGNLSSASALQLAEVPNAFAPVVSGIAIGTTAVDVDADGDGDLMRAGSGADHLLLNQLDLPDEIPPRVVRLEQPQDLVATGATPIRVQVYDNTGADRTGWATQTLSYSLDGGPFQSVSMSPMGGQVHLGELPASAVGNVRYFASSTDENGNTGVSSLKSIDTSGGCSGQAATYCTGKLNSDGCVPAIEFEGAPSVAGPTSFLIRGTDVLANANGLLIYSKAGPNSAPFSGGVLCVGAGLLRTPGQNSGGSGPCGGTLVFDFNAWVALGGDPALVAGQKVWAQYWYRDVASPGGNGLTNAVTFAICP